MQAYYFDHSLNPSVEIYLMEIFPEQIDALGICHALPKYFDKFKRTWPQNDFIKVIFKEDYMCTHQYKESDKDIRKPVEFITVDMLIDEGACIEGIRALRGILKKKSSNQIYLTSLIGRCMLLGKEDWAKWLMQHYKEI